MGSATVATVGPAAYGRCRSYRAPLGEERLTKRCRLASRQSPVFEAVFNCLAEQRGADMLGVTVPDGSRGRRHGDALGDDHVTWDEVSVMDDILAGRGAPDTECVGECEMDLARIGIREPEELEGRLVR